MFFFGCSNSDEDSEPPKGDEFSGTKEIKEVFVSNAGTALEKFHFVSNDLKGSVEVFLILEGGDISIEFIGDFGEENSVEGTNGYRIKNETSDKFIFYRDGKEIAQRILVSQDKVVDKDSNPNNGFYLPFSGGTLQEWKIKFETLDANSFIKN